VVRGELGKVQGVGLQLLSGGCEWEQACNRAPWFAVRGLYRLTIG